MTGVSCCIDFIYLKSPFPITMTQELRIIHTKPQCKNPKMISFTLFEATSAHTCPISQEHIHESELDFLNGVYFKDKNETMRGIRLKCNHEFSAMHLLYHWARNRNVLCPICRDGVADAHLDMRKLPNHFKSAFCKRVRTERQRDAREKLMEDRETAARIAQQEMTRTLSSNEISWFTNYTNDFVFVNIVRHMGQEIYCGYRLSCQCELFNATCLFNVKIVHTEHMNQIKNMGEVKLIGSIGLVSCEVQFPSSHKMQISPGVSDDFMTSIRPPLKYTIVVRSDHVFIQWSVPFQYFRVMADHYENRYILTHHGLA